MLELTSLYIIPIVLSHPILSHLIPSVGFIQEFQASSIVDELKKTLALKAVVLRGGTLTEIDASEVVLGDILEIEEVLGYLLLHHFNG